MEKNYLLPNSPVFHRGKIAAARNIPSSENPYKAAGAAEKWRLGWNHFQHLAPDERRQFREQFSVYR